MKFFMPKLSAPYHKLSIVVIELLLEKINFRGDQKNIGKNTQAHTHVYPHVSTHTQISWTVDTIEIN